MAEALTEDGLLARSGSAPEITPASLKVLGGAMLGVALGGAPIVMGSFSAFLLPISHEFGWGRAQTAGAMTGLLAATALANPIWGAAVDRWGSRAIVILQTVFAAAIVCSLSVVRPAPLWFYGAFIALGLAMPSMVPFSKALATWFARRRGLAFGLFVVAVDLAMLVAPPLAGFVLHHGGWRRAYLLFGGVGLLAAAPILFALFRERRTASTSTHPRKRSLKGDDPRAAWATGTFWLIVSAQGLGTTAYMGFTTHAVAFVAGQGFSQPVALSFASAMSFGSMAAQLITGYLFDRFDTPRVVLPFAGAATAGLVLAHHAHQPVLLLAGAVLFGVGAGGEMSTTSYFVSRYFGLRHFSQIAGSIAPFKIPLTFAPVLVGAAYDRLGSYQAPLWVLEGALLLSLMLFAALGPFRYAVPGPGGAETEVG